MRSRVLSGMQPSGRLHLGNYLGALKNWLKLMEEYEAFFFVADWHALSTNWADTSRIAEYGREMVAEWLSAGLDPKRCTIFLQSQVPEHAVLHLLLSMITPVEWLKRVPSYKEKQEELASRDLSTYGFLGYPLLQAADILIYKADFVPVGVDQLPHIELTREIARRFNFAYGRLFPEPQPLLTEVQKLPGTDGRKMSKSYDNAIYLSDPEPLLREKIRTMVTDPARVRRSDPGNPDVCPVFAYHKIYSKAETISEVDRDCRTAAIGCIECKGLVADRIVGSLAPIWERRASLSQREVAGVLEDGSQRARKVAQTTVAEVSAAMEIA